MRDFFGEQLLTFLHVRCVKGRTSSAAHWLNVAVGHVVVGLAEGKFRVRGLVCAGSASIVSNSIP